MATHLTSHMDFQSVEHVDEVMCSLGWEAEYRQMEAGSFSSSLNILEGEDWFLMEEQSSRMVEIEAPSAEGMYVVGLTKGRPAVVNGQVLTEDHVFVQCPDSEFRATLPSEVRATQIGISVSLFEELVDVLAPDIQALRDGVTMVAVTPGSTTALRRAMREALLAPSRRRGIREEVASSLIAALVTTVADHGAVKAVNSVHNAAAQKSLQLAREYIEAHLHRTIRIAALCRYAKANLRTLERIFAREMGMSPKQYVTMRRLNAVRRQLLDSEPDQGISVTDVALGHGFAHLGRFAGAYLHHFGEYPRETLNTCQ